MKLVLLAVLIASMQSDTTALVEASKAAKAKKKTGTTTTSKVITNADVKKSKGKLIEKPGTAAQVEVKQEPGVAEQTTAMRTARIAAEERLAKAEKAVADLEKQVAALEVSYYETNDLDYRDKVITKQFAEAKQKLELAHVTLSGAKRLADETLRSAQGDVIKTRP